MPMVGLQNLLAWLSLMYMYTWYMIKLGTPETKKYFHEFLARFVLPMAPVVSYMTNISVMWGMDVICQC